MTAEATVLPAGDPYEGLRELSAEIWALVLERQERFLTWTRMRTIGGGAPGIFDDIRWFLQSLLSFLKPWEMFQWLRWRVFDPFQNWLRAHFLNPLLTHLHGLVDRTLGWWGGAMNSLRAVIAGIPQLIYSAIISVPGILGNILRTILESIRWTFDVHLWALRGLIGAFPEWIRAPIRQMWEQITSHVRTLWEVFGGYFNYLREGISAGFSHLATFLHNPLEGLRQIWARFQETWAGQLLASLIGGLSMFWNTIISALRGFWAQMLPKITEAADKAIAYTKPYVLSLVEGFMEIPATFLNYAASLAGTNLALQPSRALTTAGALYALSIAAGSTALAIGTALTFLPQIKPTGVQQFAAFIAEAAGFEPLTRATYGVLINDALTVPMRYHWNQQLRPRIPTEGTIFLMGRKRGLDRGEFGQAMAYHGLPDWWIDKTYLYFWSDPSPYWLLRMSEAANPRIQPSSQFLPWLEKWLPGWQSDPWAWYKMKLMLAGFEDTDIPAFIEGFQARYIKTAITQVETSIRAMLREAYWSRGEAEAALRPLKVRQDKIELLIVAEELDYQKRFLDDDVRYFREAFRKGELDLQDLTLALSTMIVRPERVAQIVARERVRALKKPKPITQPKEDPLVTSLRRQAITSWTKQYRDWEISEEDLLLALTIVTEDADLAAEMVAVERTRYRPVPVPPPPPPEDPIVAKSRRQAIASWVTAFRKGEITPEALELNLADLIPDRETRLQIVHLETLRYIPTPELIPPPKEDPIIARIRAERVRGHIEMFQKRHIVLGQLYTFLLVDGLVEPLARATTITQANKRIRIPAIDSPYFLKDVIQEVIDQGLLAYEQMFMEGKIGIEQFTAWLIAIGVDPDVVTYLADTLTLRRFLEGL